jgi:ubiquinone/menaquinone biosynthesis C-methylase UbiE
MDRVSLTQRHAEERAHAKRMHEVLELGTARLSAARRARIARRSALITSRAGLGPGVQGLELGCGVGDYTTVLAASGAALTAVDLAEELVAIARQRLPQVRFLAVPAESLAGIPDASMDCVIGNAALHHFELRPALRSIHRVLKPGGAMCFAEPNMINPEIFLRKNVPFIKRLVGDTPHETAFVRWPLVAALLESGFVEPEATPFEFLHPGIPAFLVASAARRSTILETIPLVKEIAGSLLVFARKPG